MKVNALAPMRLIRGLAPKMCDRGEVSGWVVLPADSPGGLGAGCSVGEAACPADYVRHCSLRQLAG